MTKKVNTGLTGAETSLAAALLNAGLTPASEESVSAGAPAPATPTPTSAAPNPTSADAAITASVQIDIEIAAIKVVWEHSKSAGISKEQFLKLLELDPPKLAFAQQHKKAIFGSKKNQLAEAAQAVINANIIASGGGQEKPKKDKRSKSKALVFCRKNLQDHLLQQKRLNKAIKNK